MSGIDRAIGTTLWDAETPLFWHTILRESGGASIYTGLYVNGICVGKLWRNQSDHKWCGQVGFRFITPCADVHVAQSALAQLAYREINIAQATLAEHSTKS